MTNPATEHKQNGPWLVQTYDTLTGFSKWYSYPTGQTAAKAAQRVIDNGQEILFCGHESIAPVDNGQEVS